jgi:hypothetical protein
MIKFENDIINQGVHENCNLDIFEMINNTINPTKEVVNKKKTINF